MSEEPKKIFCPQCKEWFPETHFMGLPLDLRCNKCIPQDAAMALYDQKAQLAGQTMAKIFDSAESAKSLKPVERMVSQAYDSWGGPAAFMEDWVQYVKEMAQNPRTKSAAVGAMNKILALHARVDRMKLEDDWKQMDDETLRATLKVKMLALMSEAAIEEGKKKGLDLLGGTND